MEKLFRFSGCFIQLGVQNECVEGVEINNRNHFKDYHRDFPGGPVVKNLPANAGVMGSIPGLRRSHTPQGN